MDLSLNIPVGSFCPEGFVKRLLTALLGGLDIIVFALEPTSRVFSSQDFVGESLFAIPIEEPRTEEFSGPFNDNANFRKFRGFGFPVLFLIMPFRIKDRPHLEKLNIPLEFGCEVCSW